LRTASAFLLVCMTMLPPACDPGPPQDTDPGPGGRIWIAEIHRLVQLSADGSEVLVLGRQGPWSRPNRIAASASGGYWLTQSGAALVRTDSQFNVEWTAPPGAVVDPYDVIAQTSGVWVSDRWGRRVVRLELDGSLRCRGEGPIEPGDLATGTGDRVWVRDGYDAADVARDSLYLFEADCSIAQPPLVLKKIAAIAADGSGGVWITDVELAAVLHADATGTIVGDSRNSQLSFSYPETIAVDANGKIWVGDRDRDSILVFEPADLSLIADSGPATYYDPKRLVPASDGSVWVSDSWWDQVERLRLNGGAIERLARVDYWAVGRASGLLPLSTGGALIVDSSYEAITEVDAGGVVAGAFEGGDFGNVSAIAVDTAQRVWVADLERGRVAQYDPAGTLLQTFTHMHLSRPYKLAATSDGAIWAADAALGNLLLIAADGAVKVDVALSDNLHSLSLDGDGTSVWAAARYGNKIFLVANSGEIHATLTSAGEWYRPTAIQYVASTETLWLVDEVGRLVRLGRNGQVLGMTEGPFRQALAADPDGGVWAAFASSGASPVVRVDGSGGVSVRSSFYAASYPDGLFAGAAGGVFAVRLYSDQVVWLDAQAQEVRSWGGGLLHRPIAVAVAR